MRIDSETLRRVGEFGHDPGLELCRCRRGAAVNNKAQAIRQNRILRHSFLRTPDWTMFVPPLDRPRIRL
jgi:hypothetical protein